MGPLLQRLAETADEPAVGTTGSSTKGIEKRQKLCEKYRAKPGDRWKLLVSKLEEQNSETMEGWLSDYTSVHRDLATRGREEQTARPVDVDGADGGRVAAEEERPPPGVGESSQRLAQVDCAKGAEAGAPAANWTSWP